MMKMIKYITEMQCVCWRIEPSVDRSTRSVRSWVCSRLMAKRGAGGRMNACMGGTEFIEKTINQWKASLPPNKLEQPSERLLWEADSDLYLHKREWRSDCYQSFQKKPTSTWRQRTDVFRVFRDVTNEFYIERCRENQRIVLTVSVTQPRIMRAETLGWGNT